MVWQWKLLNFARSFQWCAQIWRISKLHFRPSRSITWFLALVTWLITNFKFGMEAQNALDTFKNHHQQYKDNHTKCQIVRNNNIPNLIDFFSHWSPLSNDKSTSSTEDCRWKYFRNSYTLDAYTRYIQKLTLWHYLILSWRVFMYRSDFCQWRHQSAIYRSNL